LLEKSVRRGGTQAKKKRTSCRQTEEKKGGRDRTPWANVGQKERKKRKGNERMQVVTWVSQKWKKGGDRGGKSTSARNVSNNKRGNGPSKTKGRAQGLQRVANQPGGGSVRK